MGTVKVILAPSAELAQGINAQLTVEAEYGKYVAQGSTYTSAHHQPGMQHLPAPCNDTKIPFIRAGTILVSHLDLDSLGGVLRGLGEIQIFKAEYQKFWDLAEFIDLNGAHKMLQSGANEENINRINAYWAWAQDNVPRFARETIHEITPLIRECKAALSLILEGDEFLLTNGKAFQKAGDERNIETFGKTEGKVIIRVTDEVFCNDLYNDLDEQPHIAVVAYSMRQKSITISLAEPTKGVVCRDIVQSLWGTKAGGHAGIAGSPRGQEMHKKDVDAVVSALNQLLG
jgi:hypothetical protein